MWRTYLWLTKFLITILNEFYDLFISYFVDADDFEPEVPVKTTDQWEGEDEDDVKVCTIFFTRFKLHGFLHSLFRRQLNVVVIWNLNLTY